MSTWKEHILKKIKPHFLEGEELLWHSGSLEDKKISQDHNSSPPINTSFLLLVVGTIFALLFFALQVESLELLLFISCAMFISFFIFLRKDNLSKYKEETFPFSAITTEHIFVEQNGELAHYPVREYTVVKTTGHRRTQMILHNKHKKTIILTGYYHLEVSLKQVAALIAPKNEKQSQLTEKIGRKYGLKHIKSITDATVLTGKYKGYWFEVRWPDSYPIYSCSIEISCPNPLDTHFSISPETRGSNLKKLFNLNDVEIGDSNFDAAFLMQTDNSKLLKWILSQKTKSIITENKKYASCSWTFGDTNKQTPNIQANKSQYHDQADVLDIQLLKQSEDQPELYADYNENLVSKLKLEANIHSDYRELHKTVEVVILNGFETVIQNGFNIAIAMVEGMEAYHKTIGK